MHIETEEYRIPSKYTKTVEAMFVTPNNLEDVALWCNGTVLEGQDPATFQDLSGVRIDKGPYNITVRLWQYLIKDDRSHMGFIIFNQIDFEKEYKEVK